MNGFTDRRLRLAAARADFLDGVEPEWRGIPDHVAASWRRSASSGVRPGEVAGTYYSDLDRQSRLVRCAGPVIEHLAEQISDLPTCVALTDNQARLVARRDSTSWLGRMLDRVHFAEGFGYSEHSVGTNGVGTVLESGESVQIVGAEHYVEVLQPFACAGAPVRDPLSGRIEGIVDISCHVDHSSPVLHSLVRAAATHIERNFLADRDQTQQALYDAYARTDARAPARSAVLAVGKHTVMSNLALQTLLDAYDQLALNDHVRFVMERRGTVDHTVRLPSGVVARLRGWQISVGSHLAGMVAVVTVANAVADADDARPAPTRTIADDVRRPPTRTTAEDVRRAPTRAVTVVADDSGAGAGAAPVPAPHPPQATDSKSPTWRIAASTISQAVRRGDSTLVLGERGTGRFTLLADLHLAAHPSGRVVAVTAAEITTSPSSIAARLRRCHPPQVLHVLRDIDTLGADVAAELRALLLAASVGGALAATASDTERAHLPHEPLLDLFHASATLPPLRNRTIDLPALVDALLADLAPHRTVRLSREGHLLVARYPWPGNLRQLRSALSEALHRRPVGRIEAEDLPAYCHSSPRSALRPLDELERDAIVTALRESDGNRVAAAAVLGLARSTLYRKIRQYGITA